MVLLALSAPLFWFSTRALPVVPPVAAPSGQRSADWRLLRRSPTLAVILLVTVICNLCYFAFMPLVPVIAEYLKVGAVMAGVIGATAGVVQLVITATLIVRPVRRPLAAYIFGVAICLCCLGIVAYTPLVTVTLLALGIAGIGQALFGSTQATLPVAAVAPHERAAALGLLSTTIGVALPTGMVALGVASSLLGAQRAMLVSALAGLAALAVTLMTSRRAISIGGERDSVTAQPELGQRTGLPVLVLDDVFEPDQRSADVHTDELGRLLVGGQGADGGLAAADANAQLSLEDQDDVGVVDVEVRRLLLAEGDVADR
jgi:predicted MFS family arabinose efflux permease